MKGVEGQVLDIQAEGRDVSLSTMRGCTVTVRGRPAALYLDRLRGCTITAGPILGACLIEGEQGAVERTMLQPVACSRAGLARGCEGGGKGTDGLACRHCVFSP